MATWTVEVETHINLANTGLLAFTGKTNFFRKTRGTEQKTAVTSANTDSYLSRCGAGQGRDKRDGRLT